MESKLPAILFILGIALLILALITGEAKGGIIIIFPFIIGTGLLSLFGILFIFLSFILFFLSFPKDMEYEVQPLQEKKKGIIFIGPIPIIFSGDIKIAWFIILLIAIFLIFIIFFLFFSLYYSKMIVWMLL